MSQNLLAYYVLILTSKGHAKLAKNKTEMMMAIFTNKAKSNVANDTEAAHYPDLVIHIYCPHPV